MLTLSLGSWMYMTFSIVPFVALVTIIALWEPFRQKLHVASLTLALFSIRYLFFVCIMPVLCGFIAIALTSNFPVYTITGHTILSGSMGLMLILGTIKPEIAPAVFFTLYTFLIFAEARLDASLPILSNTVLNVYDWLKTTLFALENINAALLMFTGGFLFFSIRHGKQMGKTILDKPLLIFLILTFISVTVGNDFLEGLRAYLVKWFFPVSIYYATFLAIKRPNGIREIKLSLVLLLFLSCLLSIQNAALTKEINFLSGERARIWTIIAGQMGPWTALILPLTFMVLLDRKERTYVRIFSLFTITLSLLMAVWEMQRVVIVDFAFMIVLTFLLYHQKWRLQLVLYATLGISVFLSFHKIEELIQLLRPSLAYGNPFALHANLDRLYLLEEGWYIFKHSPFLGIGTGGFRLLNIGIFVPEVSTHNFYLDVCVESGVIAAIFYGVIIFIPAIKFVISFIRGTYLQYEHDLRPWIISLMVFCGVHHMFHANWDWGYGAAVFCMLGVVVGTIRKAESNSKAHITMMGAN